METTQWADFRNRDGLLIDVRSPSEYAESHIPGAVNLPLLSDEHRKIIGTVYKKEGKNSAMELGYELVNPLRPHLLMQLKELAGEAAVLRTYCARGGLRSRLISGFFEESGYRVTVLSGGYKSYRNELFKRIDAFGQWVVLAGYTGTGKTQILKELEKIGEQVLDLEEIARHKGSTFGNLEGLTQPRSAMFHNLIGEKLQALDPGKRLWVESESYTIGKVELPNNLWEKMKNANGFEVHIPREERINNILNDYGKAELSLLADAVSNLKRRLGDEDTRYLKEQILQGHLRPVVDRLLKYYDQSYRHSREQRKCQKYVKIEFDDPSPEKIAGFLKRL